MMRAILAVALMLLQTGCSPGKKLAEPPRPASVPAKAVWIGGEDGGAYYNCRNINEQKLACTIYHEDGSLWVTHNFIPANRPVTPHDVSFFDGKVIILNQFRQYVPEPPSGAPQDAKYVFGEWMWCTQLRDKTYVCHVANGLTGKIKEEGVFEFRGTVPPKTLDFETYNTGHFTLRDGSELIRRNSQK